MSTSENSNSLLNKQISLSSLTIPSLDILIATETEDKNKEDSNVNSNDHSTSSILVVTTESILGLLQSKKNRKLSDNAHKYISSSRKSASKNVTYTYKSKKNKRNYLKCKCNHNATKYRLVMLCEKEDDSDIVSCDLDDNNKPFLDSSVTAITSDELTLDTAYKSENLQKKSFPATSYKTEDYKRTFKNTNDVEYTFSDTNVNDQKFTNERHLVTPDISDNEKDNTHQINKPTEYDKVLRENLNTHSKLMEDDINKRKVDIDYFEGSNGCDDRLRLHYVSETTGETVFLNIDPDQEGCSKPPVDNNRPVVDNRPPLRSPVINYQPTIGNHQPSVLRSDLYRQPPVSRPPSPEIFQPSLQPVGRVNYTNPVNEVGIRLPSSSTGYNDVFCDVCHFPIRTVENSYRYTSFCICSKRKKGSNNAVWKIRQPTYGYNRSWNTQASEHLTNEFQQAESNNPVINYIPPEKIQNTRNEALEGDVNKRRIDVDYVKDTNGYDEHENLHHLSESTDQSMFTNIYPGQVGSGKPVRTPERGNQPSVRIAHVDYQPPVKQPGEASQSIERSPTEIYQSPIRIHETRRKEPGSGHSPIVKPPPENVSWTQSSKDFKSTLNPDISEYLAKRKTHMNNYKLEALEKSPLNLSPKQYKEESDKSRDNQKCILKHHKTEARKIALPLVLITCGKSLKSRRVFMPVLKEAKNKPVLNLIRSEDVHMVYRKSRDKKSLITSPVFLNVIDKDDVKCNCMKKELK